MQKSYIFIIAKCDFFSLDVIVVKEIWEQALLAHNLPLTIVVGLVCIFWSLTMIGTIDFDSFDFDFDSDIDGELNADAAQGASGFLVGLMKLVNATDVPLMMVLSFLSLYMWVIAILSNSLFNPSHSGYVALGLLVVNFIISCVLVKFTTQPLIPFFKAFKEGENDDEPVIGRVGIVKSRLIDNKYGQVEIPRENGAPAIVNSRMADGHNALMRGNHVLVFDKDEDKKLFLVREANQETNTNDS